MNNLINVAVLGSSGYVGTELVEILSKHKKVNINFLGSDTLKNKSITSIDNKKEFKSLPILKNNDSFDPLKSDYVFLALPHSISNRYVKKYFNKVKIIDLSADFRLDNQIIYEKFYGKKHECIELLSKFTYGLVELNKELISKSKNIAVPGCYPTSILLPLIPLIKNKLIETNNIIIDSKSGYSGAGKKFDLNNIKSEKDYNFYNYNTNDHRHISEIEQEINKHISNDTLNLSFNPHILPNFRGMISTIYCDLKKNTNTQSVLKVLDEFKKNNQFIDIIKGNERLDFFSVQNTNYCKIKIFNHHSDSKVIIVSAIDNLVKGAAGQAVQCLNIMEGFEETESLL